MCSIISTITSLHQFFASSNTAENPASSSLSKFKSNLPLREQTTAKDSKAERNKKDSEIVEELPWKPWDLIWPKESLKPGSSSIVNTCGKYAVKIYWMVCLYYF